MRVFVRIHALGILSFTVNWRRAMKMHVRLRITILAAAVLLSTLAGAQATNAPTAKDSYTPTAENLKARTWFQDAKFGMFIHWGAYSVLRHTESIIEPPPINPTHYATLPPFFI